MEKKIILVQELYKKQKKYGLKEQLQLDKKEGISYIIRIPHLPLPPKRE